MNEINKPNLPTYFIAYSQDGTRHTGVTNPDQVTTSGQTSLISNSDPNGFAGEVDSAGIADFNPLPSEGEEISVGEIYTHKGITVIVRQTHIRTNHNPSDVPALFTIYRANPSGQDWIDNENVIVGDRRTYNGTTYVALQAHVTQVGWEPDNTPALWKVESGGGSDPQPWVQPQGAHDAYNTGDQVTHNSQTWESTIDANVWEPGVEGWVIIQ